MSIKQQNIFCKNMNKEIHIKYIRMFTYIGNRERNESWKWDKKGYIHKIRRSTCMYLW